MPDAPNREALRAAALDYRRRGWSVFPLRAKRKPLVKWKALQSVPADEATIAAWFAPNAFGCEVVCVGIVLGDASGGLMVRDFDEPGSYERWAAAHPDLAARLPTVRTGKGYHVYFRAHGLRTRFGSDGERRGTGGYVVAPPSLHPSGAVYQWIVPLPDGPLPEVDPNVFGALSGAGKATAKRAARSTIVVVEAVCNTSLPTTDDPIDPIDPVDPVDPIDPVRMTVDEVLAAARVDGPRQHDRRTMTLAQGLKLNAGIPTVAAARPAFNRWWEAARPYCAEQDDDFAWFKFERAWDTTTIQLGQVGVGAAVLSILDRLPNVPGAEAFGPKLRLLVNGLCEMGRRMRGAAFALSARMVGDALGVGVATAHEWLKGLERKGVIRCMDPGRPGANGTGRARRLVWVGFHAEAPGGDSGHGPHDDGARDGSEGGR